jgi:hypothetical protein
MQEAVSMNITDPGQQKFARAHLNIKSWALYHMPAIPVMVEA